MFSVPAYNSPWSAGTTGLHDLLQASYNIVASSANAGPSGGPPTTTGMQPRPSASGSPTVSHPQQPNGDVLDLTLSMVLECSKPPPTSPIKMTTAGAVDANSSGVNSWGIPNENRTNQGLLGTPISGSPTKSNNKNTSVAAEGEGIETSEATSSTSAATATGNSQYLIELGPLQCDAARSIACAYSCPHKALADIYHQRLLPQMVSHVGDYLIYLQDPPEWKGGNDANNMVTAAQSNHKSREEEGEKDDVSITTHSGSVSQDEVNAISTSRLEEVLPYPSRFLDLPKLSQFFKKRFPQAQAQQQEIINLPAGPQLQDVLLQIFGECGQVPHYYHLFFPFSPSLLMSHHALMQRLLYGEGYLSIEERVFIAISAAARSHCAYLVKHFISMFLSIPGAPAEWLVSGPPAKLTALRWFNAALLLFPWKITIEGIRHMTTSDQLNLSEIVQAACIFVTIHALSGLVTACGVTDDPSFASIPSSLFRISPQQQQHGSTPPKSSSEGGVESAQVPEALSGERIEGDAVQRRRTTSKMSAESSSCRQCPYFMKKRAARRQQKDTLSSIFPFEQFCGRDSWKYVGRINRDKQLQQQQQPYREGSPVETPLTPQSELKQQLESNSSAGGGGTSAFLKASPSTDLFPAKALPRVSSITGLPSHISASFVNGNDTALHTSEFGMDEATWLLQRFYGTMSEPLVEEAASVTALCNEEARIISAAKDPKVAQPELCWRTISAYVYNLFGVCEDDYNYSAINQVLGRKVKHFCKKVACVETMTVNDLNWDDSSLDSKNKNTKEQQPQEKSSAEAKKLAEEKESNIAMDTSSPATSSATCTPVIILTAVVAMQAKRTAALLRVLQVIQSYTQNQ